MAFTLSGNIADTPFSDIVTILRLQKATGSLHCTSGGIERSVFVQKGQIIFSTSQDERDRLGEIMVKTGRITRSQLNRALEELQKNPGRKKIGAIFVESGFVTPKELFQGLKAQVRLILQSLFLLREGSYRFDEQMPPDVIPLQINMEELLQEVRQQMQQGQ